MKYRITVDFTQRLTVVGECDNLMLAEERMEELVSGVIPDRDDEVGLLEDLRPQPKLQVLTEEGDWLDIEFA